MRISLERSILIVAEQFLWELIKKYGKNPVSTDDDDDDDGTWYPQACRFLKLRHHHTHSYYYEKSIIIERTIQYIKDRYNWNVWWLFSMSKR